MRKSILVDVLLDFLLVLIFVLQLKCSCVRVKRIRRVGVEQKLWQEDVEDVHKIVHRRPSLVNHIEAHCAGTK